MITNYIIDTKRVAVKRERTELSKRKKEIEDAITSLGISPNQAYRRSRSISEEVWIFRDKLVKELAEINIQFTELNQQDSELHRESEAERNKVLKKIFEEIFSREQKVEIAQEADRRRKGEDPQVLSFHYKNHALYKNEYYKYRTLAQEQLEKMIEFRIILTRIIEKGCEQFGDAEFLKLISPLNKLIIPINELEKIKIKFLL